MCPAGEWVALAVVLSSCLGASAAEGTKWERDPRSETVGPFSYPIKTTNTWQEVTSVLKKAEENETFPGIYNYM